MLVPCLLLLVGLLLLSQIDGAQAQSSDDPDRPAGWTEETHSNNVDPDYDVVFPVDKVNQITITITPGNWAAMQEDMTNLYGEPGSRGSGGMGGPVGMNMPPDGAPRADAPALGDGEAPVQPPDADGQAPGQPPRGMEDLGMGGPGMGGEFTTTNPIWVTSTVTFEGNVWNDVGVRFKGNSSLMSAWNSSSLKMPFKLDFDEFEDDYPEIKNQRFFGFKQLSLGNNFSDDAMLRDALAYDVYEDAGLVAANTGFYQVFLDYGEGPVDLGLYTVVEVIDDTVVKRAFGGDSGNLYEGDGRYVTLAEGVTSEQIAESFQKENNEKAADWSDVEQLYDVLHSEERTTDPEAWRTALEEVFDVDTFLKWLAVSAQIGHWDTYGAMTHNFYLYHNPETGLLTWITWDHNMTFSSGMGGGMGGGMMGPGAMGGANGAPIARPGQQLAAGEGITATADVTATVAVTATPKAATAVITPSASVTTTAVTTTAVTTITAAAAPNAPAPVNGRMNRGGPGRGVSLDKSDVSEQWPLIRFLLDDPVYYQRYVGYMAETSAILDPEAMTERIEAYADLLAPYANEEVGADTYAAAVQRVIDYVGTRAEEVQTFLDEQP